MPDLQVIVNHYGETDMLRDTLESVAEVLPDARTLVLDGRYANFDYGEGDLTPATRDLCRDYEAVEYRAPPEDRLPFGDAGDAGRRPIHEKAKWVWYEQATPDTWALKLDDDERIREFDVNLSDLDRSKKYLVALHMDGARKPVENARLWVPEKWTFYVDDLCFPREDVPRSTPFEELRDLCAPGNTWAEYESAADAIHIRNVGVDRSEDYRQARATVKNEIANRSD